MWKQSQSTTRQLVRKRTASGSALSKTTTSLSTSSNAAAAVAAATATPTATPTTSLYPPAKTRFQQRRPYISNLNSISCRTVTTYTSGIINNGNDNTNTSTKDNDALIDAFARLEQDSRALLSQQQPCPNQIENLLIEWERALKLSTTANDHHHYHPHHYHVTQTALERMDDLWQVWWQDTETAKRSSRPFDILLNAHASHGTNDHIYGSGGAAAAGAAAAGAGTAAGAASHHTNSPARALTILLAWNDTFAGDWFQAPTRKNYDALLKAHCHGNSDAAATEQHNNEDHQDNDSAATANIATADLALEVIQLLEEWGGDGMGSQQVMAPGWETYALSIQCLAKVCYRRKQQNNNTAAHTGNHQSLVTTLISSSSAEGADNNAHPVDNNESALNDESEMTYQEHLEQQMDRLLQHYLDSGGRRKRDGTLQTSHLSDTELQLLLQAWSDALQCFNQNDNAKSNKERQHSMKWKAWADDWNGLVRNSAPHLSRLSVVREAPVEHDHDHDYVIHAVGDGNSVDNDVEEHQDQLQLQHVAWLDACTTAAQQVYNHVLRGTERAQAIESTVANLEAVPWGNGFSLPLTHHYNLGIQAWANLSGREGGDANADAHQHKRNLLERMQTQHDRLMESGILVDPAQVTRACNSLMIGNLDAGSTDGMMNVWKAMATTRHLLRDSLSYSIVLKALAEQSPRSPDAAMQAHSIWKRMVSIDEARQHVRPHRQHYGWVMVAWSKSRHRQAAQYCQEVFDRLEEESQGNPGMKPDVVHYSTLITALGWRNDPAAVRKVQSIFQGMKAAGIEPDLAAYAAVLTTMARTQSLEGAQRALLLLNELEELSKEPGKEDLCPNLACYTSVIYAWARSGSPEASTQCSAVYTRLEEAFERSGRDPALQPNTVVFNALIEVEIKSGRADAGDRACALLDRLEIAVADGMAERPNSRVYTKIMTAYWKSGDKDAVAKSQAMFDRMKDAYEGGNSAAKPDTHAITTLMQAWAKSDATDKATQTWKLLDEMSDAYRQGDLDMKPSAHAFAAVLNACAYTSSLDPKVRREAIEIALKTMNELDKSFDGPNEITFRALFQVIGSQVDDMAERTRMASMIFQRCCQEGCVNGWVIKTIRNCVPPLYKKLPVDSKTQRIHLPPAWTRNVAPA